MEQELTQSQQGILQALEMLGEWVLFEDGPDTDDLYALRDMGLIEVEELDEPEIEFVDESIEGFVEYEGKIFVLRARGDYSP